MSHYQGVVNWLKVKQSGASFGFIKATEGAFSTDTQFTTNWHGSRWNGVNLIRGAYHYGHIEGDPLAQARHFVDTVDAAGGFHPGDFAILDAEDVCDASKKVGKVATAAWCSKWLLEVQRLTNLPRTRILLYTGMWWWVPRAGGSSACASFPLWLSGYTVSPPPVTGWKHWTFWQYTDKQNVPGIGKCDASQYRGMLWRLRRLAGLPWRLSV